MRREELRNGLNITKRRVLIPRFTNLTSIVPNGKARIGQFRSGIAGVFFVNSITLLHISCIGGLYGPALIVQQC